MYASSRRDNHSPERERRDEKSRKPSVCIYKLRRLCPFSDRNACPNLHLDGDDSKHKNSDDDDDRLSNRGSGRTWRDEKTPRDEPRRDRRTSRDGRSPSNERSRHNKRSRSIEESLHSERSHSRERTYHDERRYRDERTHYDEKKRLGQRKSSEICNMFTMGLCSRGQSCPDVHPGENDSEESRAEKNCIYFVRGICKRGDKCKYAHPEPDLRNLVQKQVWLKFCKRYPLQKCEDKNCSFLHITNEDEELYKKSDLISGNALGQAIRKALRFNIPLKQDNRPVCKEKLNEDCIIVNCPFLHVTREEFIRRVLGELKSEFEKVYGMSGCLFHSVKAQQDIIQDLLSPTLPNVPSAPFMFPGIPLMTPFMQTMAGCPPPPPMIAMQPTMINTMAPVEIQPAATDHRDNIDTVLVNKLRRANEQITKENEKYHNYIRVLREENIEMMRALNPDQTAVDLDDIHRNILSVFEAINWKSSLKLMEKSLDYGHKAPPEETPKHPNQQGHNRQTNKLSATNYPHNEAPAILVPQMPSMAVMPPAIPPPGMPGIPPPFMPPAIPPPFMPPGIPPPGMPPGIPPPGMPPAIPPPSMPPYMHQRPPPVIGKSWDTVTDVPDRGTNSQSISGFPEEDNYQVDPMDVAEEDDGYDGRDSQTSSRLYDQAEEEDKYDGRDLQTSSRLYDQAEEEDEYDGRDLQTSSRLYDQMSVPVPTEYPIPVDGNDPWNKRKRVEVASPAIRPPRVDWAFARHFNLVQGKTNDDAMATSQPFSEERYKISSEVPTPAPAQTEQSPSKTAAPVTEVDQGSKTVEKLCQTSNKEQNQCFSWVLGQHLLKVGLLPEAEDSDEDEKVDGDVPKKKKTRKRYLNKRVLKPDPCRIHLGNFSSVHNKDNLTEYFEKFGKIAKIRARAYYGSVLYEDVSSVHKVLNHGEPHIVNRFEISVSRRMADGGPLEHDQKKTDNPEKPKLKGYEADYMKIEREVNKIVVDGFTEAHNSENIEEYFRGFGPLKMMRLRPTYGLLTFEDPSVPQKIREQSIIHVINGSAVYIRDLDEIKEMKKSNIGKILIEKLTPAHSMKTLLDYFRTFGRITMTDHMATHAYITFAVPSIAEKLIQQTEPHVINEVEVSIRAPDPPGTDMENDKDDEPKKQADKESQNDDSVKQAEESDTGIDESQADPPDAFYKVFVGGMDKDFTENDMQEYFSVFGETYTVELRKDKKERSRGFGFITFCDYEVAKAVVSQDSHVMSGVTITVTQAAQNVKKPSKRYVQVQRELRPATQSEPNEDMAEELYLMQAKELGLMDEVDQYEDSNFNDYEDTNFDEQDDSNFDDYEQDNKSNFS